MRIGSNLELVANRRVGRHFYDIHELLADARVLDFLADRSQVEQIIDEVAEITAAHFAKTGQPFEVRPEDRFAQSPAFALESNISHRLRAAYEETMPQLYFGPGSLPSWGATVGRVVQQGELLGGQALVTLGTAEVSAVSSQLTFTRNRGTGPRLPHGSLSRSHRASRVSLRRTCGHERADYAADERHRVGFASQLL